MNSVETKCSECGGLSEPILIPADEALGISERLIRTHTCRKCRGLLETQKEQRTQYEAYVERLNRSGVPQRFLKATFESFTRGKDNEIAFRQISSYQPDQESLFIWGPPGTGKTHLSVAILMGWLRTKPGVFISVPEFIFQVKKSFFNGGYFQFAERMQNVPLLVLDDIGAERLTKNEEKTAFVRETLYGLINSRYQNKRSTIFTSNFDRMELEEKLGEPIISRIVEMSKVTKLDGEDYRLKHKRNKGFIDKHIA